MSVIWHDLECGAYAEDLPLWRALAAEHGDPVLDVGAGTGRVALDLARAGHRVTALDRDPELLEALARRAIGVDVATVAADARDFDLPERYSLIIVPMQTIQLLGGSEGRARFLACARRQVRPGGVVAIAIAEVLEPYEVFDGLPAPLPDVREHDGVVYSSQPIAVRADGDGFVLERRREMVSPAGARTVAQDLIRLDGLTVEQLEREGSAAGLRLAGRDQVPETSDYSAARW